MHKRRVILIFLIATLALTSIYLIAQSTRPRTTSSVAVAAQTRGCEFGGTYRINVEDSDRLYTAVQDAASSVPFREQQRFFMDLSVRLTPPDLLALDCSGSRVSVASSRASKVTFVADGRRRQERSASGALVSSRISMTRDTLTFTSAGKADDNLNVSFRSIDGGRRLRVTRRIDAEQLTQPIIIQSVYDKVSDNVDWDIYENRTLASIDDDRRTLKPTDAPRSNARTGPDISTGLRAALDDWIEATNRRDIDRQMSFYVPQLSAYYLTRNTPRSAVRAEKNRAFLNARSIDIRAAEPEIVFQDSGQTAVMRFRKQYRIVDRSRTRSGEVIQELRWRRTSDGWRIYSERDIRVIR